MNDLESRTFDQLPDSTWFYPGHGDSTLVRNALASPRR
jgi:glyoxylase-like metal-dependent hydrolase (beta-lactamase superfamily II)